MKDSRRDIILDKITNYTRESIADGTFSFDQCNAFNISVDLKLERSNVSRILNQLFNDLLFVKINGRPTTFLSRDVLINEFPYARIPQVVPDRQALKNCLFPSQTKVSHSQSLNFDIIGTLPNEALKDVVDKTLPMMLYPQIQPPLIIVSGEKGCGKKHFCEQLFEFAVKKKIYSEKERYIALNYNGSSVDNYTLLNQIDTDTVAMILLEVFQEFSVENIYALNNDIRNMYSNADRRQPTVFLLLDQEIQDKSVLTALSSLTPCIVRFPSFAERTTIEKIKLILSFIQEAANSNNVQIHISSDLLPILSTIHYEYNVFELRNELNYAISLASYFSKSDSVTLSMDNFSDSINQRFIKGNYNLSEASTIIKHSLPAFIDFHPGKPCTVLEYLTTSQTTSVVRLKPIDFIQDLARKDVLTTSPSLEAELVSSHIERLIHTIVTKSYLRFDIPLMNRLCMILDEMVQQSFRLQNLPEKPDFTCGSEAMKIASAIISKLEFHYTREFPRSYKVYLYAFVHYALICLQKNNIVFLVLTHQPQLNQNYARYLNYISESRSYYTFDYTDKDQENFAKYTRRLTHLFRQMDSSREFVIACDKAPLTDVAKSLTSALNVVAISLHPLNLPIMVHSAVLDRRPNLHAISMFRMLIDAKKDDAAMLGQVITRYPDNYIVSSLGTYFDNFFEQNNTILINKLLFDILKDIGNQLAIDLKASFVLEFLLHGNFMVARSIGKQTLNIQMPTEFTPEQNAIYNLVQDKIKNSRELSTLTISDNEIYVMYTLILKYFN